MNKLLLLATSLISLSIPGNATGAPEQGEASNQPKQAIHDSLIKREPTVSRPQEGFKDLFSTDNTTEGFHAAKLNPQAISFVEDYMDKHTENLEKMKGWGKPYFDMMDAVLTRHGLPNELKYLAVIESNLKTSATSWAGAVGPWQLMPETARGLGLKVSRYKDERTDFTKSTHAAARYLTQLYSIYNDWLLVIAAYNGGPGNVNAAIRKSGSRNFWTLQYHLPTESRNHVKKFIATHYIMEGVGGLTTLTRNETEHVLLAQAKSPEAAIDASVAAMTVTGKYNSLVIAQNLQISPSEFNRLNPNFDKQLSANGSYELKLPSDKMTLFQASKPQILEQSIRLLLSTVKG
jgi:membrane-bound lytic murein transglycosylase D